jgi:hypothetical protein
MDWRWDTHKLLFVHCIELLPHRWTSNFLIPRCTWFLPHMSCTFAPHYYRMNLLGNRRTFHPFTGVLLLDISHKIQFLHYKRTHLGRIHRLLKNYSRMNGLHTKYNWILYHEEFKLDNSTHWKFSSMFGTCNLFLQGEEHMR